MPASLVSLDYRIPTCDTGLEQLPVVIGSSPDAEMCLDDYLVSPHHCRIEQVDGQFIVSDLGSVHGTHINGERITKSPLKPGDTLSVGNLSFFLEWQPQNGERRQDGKQPGPRVEKSSALVR